MSLPVFPEVKGSSGEHAAQGYEQHEPTHELVQAEKVPDVRPLSSFSPEGEACRRALLNYIDKSYCWGTAPAKKCDIGMITPFVSCVTTLRSFAETRNTCPRTLPFRGGNFTMSGQGRTPNPWEMPLSIVSPWQEGIEKHEVPFTSHVAKCGACGGDGKVDCGTCHRSGHVSCSSCGGDGRKTFERDGQQVTENCSVCGGDGKCTCTKCSGSGQVSCATCQGAGQLRHYVEMTRQLRILKHYQVVDDIPDSDLEPAKIEAAPGVPILDFSAGSIIPPVGYSPSVDQALVNINVNTFTERGALGAYIHQQRLEIKLVNVVRAEGKYKSYDFYWFVYGTDEKIESKTYPAQCCCGCFVC